MLPSVLVLVAVLILLDDLMTAVTFFKSKLFCLAIVALIKKRCTNTQKHRIYKTNHLFTLDALLILKLFLCTIMSAQN